MANTLIRPTVIARLSLAILRHNLVLGGLVNRDAEADFAGSLGDTVNIRKPASLTARRYNRGAGQPIVLDDITESSVPVVLNTEPYSAVGITDKELTLDLADFRSQVLEPQVKAVAEDVEAQIAAEAAALTGGLTVEADGSDFHAQVIEAGRLFDVAKVPAEGRILALSANHHAAALLDPDRRLVPYDASGDADALRNATIGMLYGFRVVKVLTLPAAKSVAFHRDAFALVNKAPVVPDGVSFGQSISEQGYALRWIRDYDAAYLRDRSVVSTFSGTKTLDTDRAIAINTAA